jgi:hypothetical protein
MSDYAFIIGEGAKFTEDVGTELEEAIRSNFTGVWLHNKVSRVYVISRSTKGGVSFVPLGAGGVDLFAFIAEWLSSRSDAVVVRLEGHRGDNPLPQVDRRVGTWDDVSQFRRRGRKAYLVEYEMRLPD